MSDHKIKRAIVNGLERACHYFHWITWHAPWRWLPIKGGYCLLAKWSIALDYRWELGEWDEVLNP